MKKIFLTSGLVLCMACPAFATQVTGPSNDPENPNNECVENILGVDHGTATLEAIWTKNKYAVTYAPGLHGTGGATYAADSAGAVEYDSTYTVLAPGAVSTPVVANSGYTFAGWNDGTDTRATGYVYNPYHVAGALTLTALWTANPYTITYNCGSAINGSSEEPQGPTVASTAVQMDGSFTLAAADNCTLQGYTFAGWSCPNLPATPTLPAGDPAYFAGGATGTYSYAGNVTCTAQWTRNSITLVWDDNDSTSGSIANTSCTYDGSITLPTQPTKTGYTFGGWEVVTPAPAPAQGD